MPLFAVERDLSQVAPEHFRSNLQALVTACARLQGLGKKVRYISSAVFPAEARGLCLFGAEQPQWIQEANEAARLPYSRIFAVLDLTPTGVRRDLSRGRWPVRVDAPAAVQPAAVPREATNGTPPSRGTARVADEMTRWSDEARQLIEVLGGWLEDAGRLQGEVGTLERERATLADEVRRLEQENDGLRAERDDLSVAIQTIAGQTARTVDDLLERIHGRREAPGDLAPR
jgi:Nickel responsive protein SCO4226-like